ncbi:unnamed protein product [Polarella glacialis]|uniref:Uncharacterized protein n=1 Tax=Polarella glacialis TaxID=89957 RepID=A0A813EMV7_POLGL|nr:unnamed protein product [Polarella glacialis]
MLRTGSSRCIAFCRDKAECSLLGEVFTQICLRYFGVDAWSERVTEELSDIQRCAALRRFADEHVELRFSTSWEGDFKYEERSQKKTLKLLTSVRILDEAVDIPECDSVFYANLPTSKCSDRALARTVQRLCRALRVHDSKPARVASAFLWTGLQDDNVLDVLAMLKDLDPSFSSKLRVCSTDYDFMTQASALSCEQIALETFKERYQVAAIRIDTLALTEWRVQCLCTMWPALLPKIGEAPRIVPEHLRCDGAPLTFHGRLFLNACKANWLPSCPTRVQLSSNQKGCIEQLPWWPAIMHKWCGTSAADKVRWLCHMLPEQRPKSNGRHVVPPGLLPVGCLSTYFNPYIFLRQVSGNWCGWMKEKEKTFIFLSSELMKEIEALPWFPACKTYWENQVSVEVQVKLLCQMWPEHTPRGNVKCVVPVELLPPGRHSMSISGSHFMRKLMRKFSRVSPNLRRQVEALPWFPVWKLASQKRHDNYLGTVAEKVHWMCHMWPEQRPKQGDKRLVPPEIAPRRMAASFDGGLFLRNIAPNWCDWVKTDTTTSLTPDLIARAEALPWFPDFLRNRRKRWEVKSRTQQVSGNIVYQGTVAEKVHWMCHMWPEQRPKRSKRCLVRACSKWRGSIL